MARNSDQIFLPLPWGVRTAESIPSRRYLLFEEVGPLIELRMITNSMVDPENQREIASGLTRITLIGTDGNEYDVVARYNPMTGTISRPV
jgi:hypothetical protein